jgi:Glycosyl hydrolase family 79 C-terminal beta domain
VTCSWTSFRRAAQIAVGPFVILAVGLSACGGAARSTQPRVSTRPLADINAPSVRPLTIDRGTVGRSLPAGFVGLSMEFRGLEAYAGTDPRAVDPGFEQLMRNLAPGQRPVLRIGGDGTDWTWWPLPHVPKPPGIRFSLSNRWIQVTRALSAALDARLILGVNLEANSTRVGAGEAQAEINGIGRRAIQALEIGNEPELYGSFGWFRAPNGQGVLGRPRGYDFAAFMSDYSRFAQALPRIALAGPSTGTLSWMQQLSSFLPAEPRLGLVTLHAYPLKHCGAANNVTAGQLLAQSSSAGLAAGVAPFIQTAHQHGLPARIDEMNGISCGGQRGVSDSFASALWVLDALFEMAHAGVDGVNVHTVPNTINELIGAKIQRGTWELHVHPEYYGMMMFAQAAPAGAHLLQGSWQLSGGVKVWATRSTGGVVHVVLINKRLRGSRTVTIRIPAARGPAAIERLQAPSVHATGGVTLGGQTFGAESSTGMLAGRPSTTTITPVGGAYVVRLPAVSAAMLTIPASAALPVSSSSTSSQ